MGQKQSQQVPIVTKQIVLEDGTLETVIITQSIKKKPLLVNIARGPIIEEKDLIFLLKKEIIKGACLDVFENEPLAIKSKLKKFNNVILTSHNAFNTVEEVNKVINTSSV